MIEIEDVARVLRIRVPCPVDNTSVEWTARQSLNSYTYDLRVSLLKDNIVLGRIWHFAVEELRMTSPGALLNRIIKDYFVTCLYLPGSEAYVVQAELPFEGDV